MDLDEYFKLIITIFGSVGGLGTLIVGLAKHFGNTWANKMLEEVKKDYQMEINEHKANLEKSKLLYFRYSDEQFKLYNDLWHSLCDLECAANELFKIVSKENLTKFVNQLDITITDVKKNALLLEDNHYNQLMDLFNKFKEYKIGKQRIIDLMNNPNEISGIQTMQISLTNSHLKDEYSNILAIISKTFKLQIKGVYN